MCSGSASADAIGRSLGLAGGQQATTHQGDPAAADAALGAADLGAVDLGAGVLAGLDGGVPDRQHRLATTDPRGLLLGLAHAEGGEHRGHQQPGQRLVAGGGRVELVGPEQQGRGGGELRAEDRARARRYGRRPRRPRWSARRRDDATRPARPGAAGIGIGEMVPRSGQVPTTTATSASRRRRTASERWRTDAAGQHRVGDVVGADQDDGDVGVELEGGVDLGLQVARLRPDDGELAQVHAAVRLLGHAGAEPGAGGLLDGGDAVAGSAGVTQQGDLDRRTGATAAVPAGGVRHPAVGVADRLAGQRGLGPEHPVERGAEHARAHRRHRRQRLQACVLPLPYPWLEFY